MLKSETEFTYERKRGDTVYIIESISDKNSRVDMVDALIALMKHDMEEMGKSDFSQTAGIAIAREV